MEGRNEFLPKLEAFGDVIRRREYARFAHWPHVMAEYIGLLPTVAEVAPGRYRAVA